MTNTTQTLDEALKEVAMGHLLGEYDYSDIAHELTDQHPDAWDRLPADAKKAGLDAAGDADEDDASPEQLARLMRHLMNTGAIRHELGKMVDRVRGAYATPDQQQAKAHDQASGSGDFQTPGPDSDHQERSEWAAQTAARSPAHAARLAACLMMQGADLDGGRPDPQAAQAFADEAGRDWTPGILAYAAEAHTKA